MVDRERDEGCRRSSFSTESVRSPQNSLVKMVQGNLKTGPTQLPRLVIVISIADARLLDIVCTHVKKKIHVGE